MTCIFVFWHIHAEMWHATKKTFMVVTVSIRPFRNMLKAVIIQKPQKAGISGVTKVFQADLFLEQFRDMHSERTTMSHPTDDGFVLFLG
mmetsp:Transcript_22920/g.33829  ORF Transcript_22920/g.33829 Transcript_22920/m.33829 type:complete len:89 (-) Transcript_22920:450-716(-)